MRSWPFIVIPLVLLLAAAAVWRLGAGARPIQNDDGAVLSPAKPPPRVRPPYETRKTSIRAAMETPWFTDRTAGSGVDFQHESGASAEKPFPAANGSGVAALDYDLNGRYDLYFATGVDFPIVKSATAHNRCFRNVGPWRFEDITDQCGLGHNGYSAGLAAGDFDADGFPDLFVACYGADCLFRNQGDGTFQAVEREAGVADDRWGTSAAFLDYDADGLLDLYVCNYAEWTWETNQFCGDRERNVRLYCSPHSVAPAPHFLYHNRGDGTFESAAQRAGVADRLGRGQGVIAADFNDDGLVDLYVGNDLHPNFVYLNRGDGGFRDATETSGAAYDYAGNVQAGMGVEAADYNNDGRCDLFVTNFQSEHNALYENLGNEMFQDVSFDSGSAAASLPWVGWGTALVDFDLDGWLDMIVTNGHVDDNRDLLGQYAPYAQPGLVWRNVAGRFELLGEAAGEYFASPHVGRGLAAADLDGDGDEDVVIGHQDGRPALLENSRLSPQAPHGGSIVLRLVGVGSNRDAIGAQLALDGVGPEGGGARIVQRQVKGGGSYLSRSDPRLTIAAPDRSNMSLRIRWPNRRDWTACEIPSRGEYLLIEPDEPSLPVRVIRLR